MLVSGGVRYDHSNVFGGSTNPRFALVYNPAEKTTVKFLYGQAFRAPNVYELYVQHSASGSNLALEPERIKTAEIVVEQYLGDRVRVAASAFTYRIKNLISQTTDASPTSIFVNLGRVRSSGFEAEVETKSNFGLQGLFSYAFQSSRDSDSGQRLTNSPAHMLKLNLNAPVGIKRTFAGLELQYLSDRLTLSRGTADDFLVTNLTLLSERIKNRFDLSFSVYNLFDAKYGNPAGAEFRQDIIPQDGRSFRLKLTYRFSNR
jgi:iron complex outermembrane receptor protein